MGLELVLNERAADGKAALADGAVEGQRGRGAELAMRIEILSICNHGATLTGSDKPFDWELQTTTMRKVNVTLTTNASPRPRAPSTSGEPALHGRQSRGGSACMDGAAGRRGDGVSCVDKLCAKVHTSSQNRHGQ